MEDGGNAISYGHGIRTQEVGGSFTITGTADMKLSDADFAMYDITAECEALDEDGEQTLRELHFDRPIGARTAIDHSIAILNFWKAKAP